MHVDFGDRLRALREKSGWSRYVLAEKLNASYSTIAKYETNARFPDRETLVHIANLFGVSVDWLLGRIEEMQHSEQKMGILPGDNQPVDISKLSPEEQELYKELKLHFTNRKKLTPGQIRAMLAIIKMNEEEDK